MQPHHRLFLSIVGCLLLMLLAACGSSTSPSTASRTPTTVSRTSTTGVTPSLSPTVSVSPQPLPPDCPPAGKGRAAVMPPMILGGHQNIVYIVDERQGNAPTFGTLKRYDVTTGNKTEIVKIPGISISDAQVSADGQWILFVANTDSNESKLQMVRMDGQGLQTLYCAQRDGLLDVQWSSNQRFVVFDQYGSVQTDVYLLLLDMASGSVQIELYPTPNFGFVARSWLDATHLYVSDLLIDQPPAHLYLLDTARGPGQHIGDLLTVLQPSKTMPYPAVDFDSSYDGSRLFTNLCVCGIGGSHGPSTIAMQPVTGGQATTIYSSQAYAVTRVRAISASRILFLIDNENLGSQTDTSHNGLWVMDTSGAGLLHLVSGSSSMFVYLNLYSQDPWSNISRDGSMYAAEVILQGQGQGQTPSLIFGSLSGGTPTTFASISDGTQLEIVGWTTM